VIDSDSFEFLRNHPMAEHLISFQIPIGLPDGDAVPGVGFCHRPIDERDVPTGRL